MPNLNYTVADFQPLTKIISSDVNSRFNDVKTLLNTTGLDSTNIQQFGLTRDRLAKATANQVVINDGVGALTSEAQLAISRGGLGSDLSGSLSSNSGNAIIVNPAGNALLFGTPTTDRLTETFTGDVSTLTAGEAITSGAAVCLDLNNGNYKIFNCNTNRVNRKINFLGFAANSGTVTAGVYTYVANANFVNSNVITTTINGRVYVNNFSTDNPTTLGLIATTIATDPEVQSAASDGVHTITVTSKGGLTLVITAVVTAGGAQPTIAFTQTTAPVGSQMQVRCFGPFSGLTSLVAGQFYYLDTANGVITATPTDSAPVQVGQALSSTVLFVTRNVGSYSFGTSQILITSHGLTTPNSNASATALTEQFNFTSWSTTVADSVARGSGGGGESTLTPYVLFIDGADTAGTVSLYTKQFNKSSWANGTTRSTAKSSYGMTILNGLLYCGKGGTATGSGVDGLVDAYNNSSWSTSVGNFAGNGTNRLGSFTQGGKARWCGGGVGASGFALHDSFNGSATASETAVPVIMTWAGSGRTTSSNGTIFGNAANATASYVWSGSWGSSVAVTYGSDYQTAGADKSSGASSGFNSSTNITYSVGGSSSSTVPITTTAQFNGTTWSASTSRGTAVAGSTGACF